MSKRLTVALPTYNRESMLRPAIESVLKCPRQDFELLIVDNASKDKTGELVASFDDPRIVYKRYDEVVSMYANHNRCIRDANSEWVAFLHSDDKFSDLENAFKLLDEHGESADVVWTHSYIPARHNHQRLTWREILKMLNGYSPCGKLYRASAVENAGFFAEDNIISDWETCLHIAYGGGTIVVDQDKPFVERVFHEGQSQVGIKYDGTFYTHRARCVKRFFASIRPEDREALLDEIASDWDGVKSRELALLLNLAGRRGDAREVIARSTESGRLKLSAKAKFKNLIASALGERHYEKVYWILGPMTRPR
ncbi:MAG: glycosyltransferase family A protein [Sumerlaeia bacterium]